MQSNVRVKMSGPASRGLHVGIIMDGNGRWATQRGMPRSAGHHAGVAALRRVVEAAPGLGIGTLTVYAFSSDNWRRPPQEVGALMLILRRYLELELARLVTRRVRLTVIGRRDRLPADIIPAIGHAEHVTADGRSLDLRIALDYSAREAIVQAAAALQRIAVDAPVTRDAFSQLLGGTTGAGDVDLLIRTSGEQRLSDFLLWESAYAELYFTERLWPDFDGEDLADALQAFRARERRFGGPGGSDGADAADAAVAIASASARVDLRAEDNR